MAKTTNTSFDPSAMFSPASFDPSAMFAPFKMPGFDIDALIALQRRNLEAFSTANKLAADGVKALATRQAEMTSVVVDDVFAAMRDMFSAQDPQEGASKQVELTKAVYAKSLSNMRELSELATKSNTEAFEVLSKRAVEGLDEFKSLAKTA